MTEGCGGGCIAGLTIGSLLAVAFLASIAYCIQRYLAELKTPGS